MKIFKKDLEKYLNSFSWDFRELFFEKSKTFKFVAINWVFKTPQITTLDWFSVLSRENSKEYFQVFAWDNSDIEKKISKFRWDYQLNKDIKELKLSWCNSLELKELNEIEFNLEDIIKNTQEILKNIPKEKKELIKASEISLNFSYKSFIVWNTLWNFSSDKLFYNTFFIKLVWEKNWVSEEVFEKIAGVDIIDNMTYENLEKSILNAISDLEKQFMGEPSPSGEMDVIIWNEAGWTIIHEAVWHWLEADLQNSSVYKDMIWKKVASELVSIADNPTLVTKRWFYWFDHEWEKSKNALLIENWVLKSYLHNAKTASKFWHENTWHWRKETYKHKTLVRMWITYLLPGKDKKEEVIKRVQNWLYVSKMWWWQVNTSNWDFVFKVQNWYKIENWVLTTPVRWATLSWNWPEMLKNIFAVCDDLDFFDWWTCGKWQSMPVSDGTPTILTKLKVSWI